MFASEEKQYMQRGNPKKEQKEKKRERLTDAGELRTFRSDRIYSLLQMCHC